MIYVPHKVEGQVYKHSLFNINDEVIELLFIFDILILYLLSTKDILKIFNVTS